MSKSSIKSVATITPHETILARLGLQLIGGEEIVSIDRRYVHYTNKRKRAVSPQLSLKALTDDFTKPSRAATVTSINKGVPAFNLYDAFFPRDAHVVAYFLRAQYPKLTKATVLECLKYTGIKDNLHSTGLKDEQEIGKVPHEIRDPLHDPLAVQLTQEKDWGWPYYGAMDTTVKNIRAIAYLVGQKGGASFLERQYKGMDGRVLTVEDGLRLHLGWLRRRLDFNPEGLLESLWINPKHHAAQTWADSADTFHHADGSWPSHHPEHGWGVAGVELQAETYDALMDAADLYTTLAKEAHGPKKKYFTDEADDLQQRAEHLKKTVVNTFWVPDDAHFGGFFARGTDRDDKGRLRPLAIRSSDMGHLLNSRILDGEAPAITAKRDAVIKNLFSAEMLCPNGIRTLSSDSVRYYKDKYHNGASWPWVTYFITLGLRRHGYQRLAQELEQRILSFHTITKLLPEYGSGSDDPAERLVTDLIVINDPTTPEKRYNLCQPAQEVQAWTAAALLSIKMDTSHKRLARPTQTADEQKRRLEEDILRTIPRSHDDYI